MTILKKYYTGNEILEINKTINEAKQGVSWMAGYGLGVLFEM